jgi:hypothetical protein
MWDGDDDRLGHFWLLPLGLRRASNVCHLGNPAALYQMPAAQRPLRTWLERQASALCDRHGRNKRPEDRSYPGLLRVGYTLLGNAIGNSEPHPWPLAVGELARSALRPTITP